MTHDPVTEMSPARRAAVAAAADGFGVDLYRRLGADEADLVFSPASIAAALQLALLGARGSTAGQLAAALHLGHSGDPVEAAEEGLRLLSSLIQAASAGPDTGAGPDTTLRAPNTLWLQAGLALEPGFTRPVRDAAAAQVLETDFRGAPQQARAAINELIADQTAGKITNLLGRDAIDAGTRLVLANAVYLKARWVFPFTATATRDAPFHPGAGAGPIQVPTMHRTANLPYRRGDGYQAVLLPYQDLPLSMAIVLPDGPPSGPAQSALAATLDSAGGLGPLLSGAEPQSVALALPKFRQRTRAALIPVLRQLGVQDAFTDAADFTGITTAERLQIGAVVHQAYIDVDEQGTEAAAATAVGMRALALRRGPEPIPVTVDRPFLFAIIDQTAGLPLFLGQVTRPGQ
jgi:serpin B